MEGGDLDFCTFSAALIVESLFGGSISELEFLGLQRPKLNELNDSYEMDVFNIRWLTFTQTNNLCTNSSFGNGVHNFDFRKPAK